MKRFNILIMFICFSCFLKAQLLPVNVYVVDEQNNPVSGVVMKISGNENEIFTTDEKGIIHFQAEPGTEVTFSQFNKMLRKLTVKDKDVHVRLDRNARLLEVGYDEKITKENTALAVSGVTAEEMQISGQSNAMNTLYGLIPGLTVLQRENQPWNVTPSVYIRGRGSFGGNSVIVLVDGVERDISNIHRDEIESVTVLKDAASLALYGNRGADGVICFTTKRGGDYKLRTQVDYNFSVQTPFRIPEMADAPTYANALNEALENDGLAPRYTQHDIRTMMNGDGGGLLPNVNWKKELLRKAAFNHDLNLSFDGNSQRMRYYVFANYTSNRGLMNNTNLNDGYSTQVEMYALKLRTNLETYITPTTVARMNLMGHLQQYQQPISGTDLGYMYNTPSAAFPIKSPQGVWAQNWQYRNPLAEKTARGYGVLLQRTLFADLTIDQDLSVIARGLSAQLRIAYDNGAEINDSKSKDYAYYNTTQIFNESGNVSDILYSRYGNDTELSFNNGSLSWQVMRTTIWGKVDYVKSFNQHHLKAAGIYSQGKAKYRGANNTFMYRDYILNMEYNYDNRYIVNGVLSYSGSAKLSAGDKYRLYPAVSAAWILSNEKFMSNLKAIDYLKLRASYGIVGMDARLSYDMDKQFNGSGQQYIFVGTVIESGMAQGGLPSVNVEPEKEYKANVGLEFGLWKGLSVELDGFYNRRKNIRVSSGGSVSTVLGVGVPDVFTGEVKNYGAEFSLGWKQQICDIGYSIRGNIAYAKNEIINMEETYHPYDYMNQTGQSIGRFYGLVADGLYQKSDFDANGNLKSGIPTSSFITNLQPGDVKYKDLNHDGKIDDYDNCYQLRNQLPEIYYGFTLGANYKNIGFNAYFQGVARSTVTTNLSSIYHPLYGNDKNISNHYLTNYWSEYTPEGRYPRLTTLSNNNNYRGSSLWTEKGDYLKLRTLEVYYKMPTRFIKGMKMSECRFFFKGLNLFSIDHVGVMDPEYISMGYPSMRSYLLGVNVQF